MEKVKLVDICNPKQWATISTDKLLKQGYPAYGANGKIGYYDKYNHEQPTLLITCRGATCGTINISEPKSYINGNAMCLDDLREEISLKYLYYQLLNYNFKDVISGSAQPQITREGLSKVQLNIHSLEEQKAIAERLDKVSGLIEKRKTQLEKLDLLIKSRFIELFGEVGTNIKGWGFKRLGDCCTINPKKGEDKRLHQELIVSFVPMPAVSEKGEIDASEKKSYDEVKTGFTYFAEQDVLFAKITPCMENGKGAVAKGLCNGIGFGSTEFHVLRPIKGVSNPYWLYTVTAFKQFRMDAASNMTGSAGQRRVPASFLDAYKVSLPPIELQHKFATFVEQTDKSKFEIQKSLEKLEILKKSLMQQYFG